MNDNDFGIDDGTQAIRPTIAKYPAIHKMATELQAESQRILSAEGIEVPLVGIWYFPHGGGIYIQYGPPLD